MISAVHLKIPCTNRVIPGKNRRGNSMLFLSGRHQAHVPLPPTSSSTPGDLDAEIWPRHGPVRSLSCSRKLDMPSFPDRLHVQMGRARGGKSSDEELDVEYQRKGPRGCSTVHRVGMDDFTELKSSAWRPRIARRTHGTAGWFTAGSSLLALRKAALTSSEQIIRCGLL